MKRCPARRAEPSRARQHASKTIVDLREQSAKTVAHNERAVALKEQPAPDHARDNRDHHPYWRTFRRSERPVLSASGSPVAHVLAPAERQVFENRGPYWI